MSYPNKPARLLAVIEDLLSAASRSRSADAILQAYHHHLGRVLDTNSLYVALWNEPAQHFQFPLDVDAGGALSEPDRLEGSLTDFVRRTGRPLWCDRSEHERLQGLGQVKVVGKWSEVWVGVPLRARGAVFGVAALQHYQDPFAYTPADLRTFSLLSDAISPALAGFSG
ncbi:MAG: GAF domain-containing protein [Proteobacteria bacterium]|nr:GAF domain-containing protein [Pseudomonadota bacterium]